VVSDCGAIGDIYKHHQVVDTAPEAAALAVTNGCDLNCGEVYSALLDAVDQGLIDEATIDRSLKRLFTARFRLGMFDPPERVPYAQIPIEVNDSEEHRALALRMAQESIVLLKNAGGFLPLYKDLETIAVVGPNADDDVVLLANYNGTPSRSVTPLAGIRDAVDAATKVRYAKGCEIRSDDTSGFDEAVAVAEQADVVVAVMGLSQLIEGEEGQREGVAGGERSTGDRSDLVLPGVQDALLQALEATGTPMVVVLLNGSAVAVNWAHEHAEAIVEAWYPGEEGGTAIADVLFGDVNPAGRLPVTFYQSVDQLPPFRDYAMAGHTYRFFAGEPLYPFGHGLSYTTFAYRDLTLGDAEVEAGECVDLEVTVVNTGDRAGDEVVQLYVRDEAASVPVPIRQLKGFRRIHLEPGEAQTVRFCVMPMDMAMVSDGGRWVVEPGAFSLFVGGGQPGTGAPGVAGRFEVVGDLTVL
jgi:beta-glucosidase